MYLVDPDQQVLDHHLYTVMALPEDAATETKLWMQHQGCSTFQYLLESWQYDPKIVHQPAYQVGNLQGRLPTWVLSLITIFLEFAFAKACLQRSSLSTEDWLAITPEEFMSYKELNWPNPSSHNAPSNNIQDEIDQQAFRHIFLHLIGMDPTSFQQVCDWFKFQGHPPLDGLLELLDEINNPKYAINGQTRYLDSWIADNLLSIRTFIIDMYPRYKHTLGSTDWLLLTRAHAIKLGFQIYAPPTPRLQPIKPIRQVPTTYRYHVPSIDPITVPTVLTSDPNPYENPRLGSHIHVSTVAQVPNTPLVKEPIQPVETKISMLSLKAKDPVLNPPSSQHMLVTKPPTQLPTKTISHVSTPMSPQKHSTSLSPSNPTNRYTTPAIEQARQKKEVVLAWAEKLRSNNAKLYQATKPMLTNPTVAVVKPKVLFHGEQSLVLSATAELDKAHTKEALKGMDSTGNQDDITEDNSKSDPET